MLSLNVRTPVPENNHASHRHGDIKRRGEGSLTPATGNDSHMPLAQFSKS